MQFFHAGEADICFFFQVCSRPEICFALRGFVLLKNLHLSYEKKSNLARKLELFYKEIEPKREETNEKMRLQIDLEFQQIETKKLNEKYNVDMFSTKVRGEKPSPPSRKLGSLRSYFSRVRNYIRRPKQESGSEETDSKRRSKHEQNELTEVLYAS